MKIPTTTILQVLRLLALLAFVGFIIEGSGILVSFIVSFYNPEAAKDLYKGLDMHELKAYSNTAYYCTVITLITVTFLKAMVWQKVMNMLSHLKLGDPFKPEIVKFLRQISNMLIAAWAISFVYNIIAEYIIKRSGHELVSSISTDNLLFMAGLIFIITQVFKRGIEIQSENEFTV